MKRTTYIFIGIFLANIVLGITILFYIKSSMVSWDEVRYKVEFGGERKHMDLSDVHTLEFIAEAKTYFYESGNIIITPSSDGTGGKMAYPASDFLKLEKQDGILKVTIDIQDEHRKQEDGKMQGISLSKLLLEIETGNQLKEVRASVGMDITFNQLILDTLYLNANYATIESCTLHSLFLNKKDQTLKAHHSAIKDLHVELNKVRQWSVDNCRIETLYLAGSGNRRTKLEPDQYGKVVWEPQNDDSELTITLKKGAEISFID